MRSLKVQGHQGHKSAHVKVKLVVNVKVIIRESKSNSRSSIQGQMVIVKVKARSKIIVQGQCHYRVTSRMEQIDLNVSTFGSGSKVKDKGESE